MLSQQPQRNDALLERLERAKAKSKIKQSGWPDRHVVGRDGQPVPFHLAQSLAHDANRRFVILSSGTQLGKTGYTPWWLKREIETCGGGDYIVATSSFDLLKMKLLPQMLLVFVEILGWCRYWAGDKVLELKDPLTGKFMADRSSDTMWGRIIMRSAQTGGGLESATAKAAILDEAGQDEFTIDAWRAIRRRLTLYRGRVLITTTLYGLSWLNSEMLQPVLKSGVTRTYDLENGSSIDYTDDEKNDTALIQADSTVNPDFPREEYEEAKAKMPSDEFFMFFRGRVTKPRHLIFDCFNGETHIIPSFKIQDDWQRYLGLDFGGINTAGIFLAEDPQSKKLYCYKEYHAGKLTAKEHVNEMLLGEPAIPLTYGGAKAEVQWRKEFRDGGLSVKQPKIADVWLGINIVYGEIKANNFFVFEDCTGLIFELNNYRRKYDSLGNPTDEIFNKSDWHKLDGLRYVVASIRKYRGAMIAFA